jgi:diguanylate cyclase (GGDEF)-like protein
MGSFKVKLVAWFALLALLPLGIAFYGYGRLAGQSETRRADATLEAALRVATAGYGARLDAAAVEAEGLAAQPALERALRGHDRAGLARALRGHPRAAVVGSGVRAGNLPQLAGRKSIAVIESGRLLGRVIVSVPLDAVLLAQLDAALPSGDRLVVTKANRIVAGVGRGSELALAPAVPQGATIAGTRYRALATGRFAEPAGIGFAALAPQRSIDSAARSVETTLAVALAAALLIFALATYLLGRSVVETLRSLASAAKALAEGRLDQRVELRGSDEFAELGAAFNQMAGQLQIRLDELELARARAREANVRFGAALAATLEPAQLLQVVVESVVEATGATGGVVVRPDGQQARIGDPDAGPQRIAFPLRAGRSDFGSLVLSGTSFDSDQVDTAASLAAQAVVALDNARLHRIVERQALLDGLTGLANRRSIEDSMRGELARAARFSDRVCFVIADLDDFKQVNDRYGHPTGDEALRFFARTLDETVREMDVAGRWGGEEFALVLPATDLEGGRRLAERARIAFAERTLRAEDGSELSLTASFGVAAYPEEKDLEGVIAAADGALYEAKRTGKNRVVVAERSIHT